MVDKPTACLPQAGANNVPWLTACGHLHYLLLHLDRLNGSALTYLRNAVEEEIVEGSRLLDRLMREAHWDDAAGARPPEPRRRRGARK